MGTLAEVVEVSTESPSEDATGQITGGYLRLRGPLCTAHFQPQKKTNISMHSRVGVRMGGVETSKAVYEDILDEMRLSEQNVGGHQHHLFVIELHPGDSCNLSGLVL